MESWTGVAIVVALIALLVIWGRRTNKDAPASWTDSGGLLAPRPEEGPVITRSFRGSPEATSLEAARFLASIRKEGWSEVSRTYTPGSWGCGAFLLALLAFLILIGILIFIYMVLVKPAGVLVVTYERA